MHLLNLAPEILLHIASYLAQADLLNITLTNRRLRHVTEPELFREYANTHMYGRSFKPFILRLIDRPELAKYVHRVDLRAYKHLADLNPEYGPVSIRSYLEQCTADDYKKLIQAAIGAGVIDEALPFEPISSILSTMTSWEYQARYNEEDAEGWYDFLYDTDVSTDKVPFDTKFCKLLRIGLDEPLVILLLALLPNIWHLDVWGAPYHPQTLPWRIRHGFKALQHFTVCATDGELDWPLAFFDGVVDSSNIKTYELYKAGEEWRENTGGSFGVDAGITHVPLSLAPGSTKITHLVMQYCALSRTQMRVLLYACPRLTSLYFSAKGEEVGPKNFIMSDLVELLSPQKTVLEELFLDMGDIGEFDDPIDSLPSLRDFTSLRKLDTTVATWGDLLLGPIEGGEDVLEAWLTALDSSDPLDDATEKLCSRLPQSLQCFVLHEQDEGHSLDWDYRQLEHLISQRRTALPNLHQVMLVEREEFAIFQAYLRLYHMSENSRPSYAFLDNSSGTYGTFRFDIMAPRMYECLHKTVFRTEEDRLRSPTHCMIWKDDRYAREARMPTLQALDAALVDHLLELGMVAREDDV